MESAEIPEPSARPLVPPQPIGEPRADAVRTLLEVIDRLRSPEGGCPWDLSQTVASLAPGLIEEAHECVEAVESGDRVEACGELGDVLMLVVLLARVAEDEASFDLAGVAHAAVEKLVRRHPHVFGSQRAEDRPEALESWERAKRAERREKGGSVSALDGVPLAMPALQRTFRVGQKAISAGFRWKGPSGALAKLREELGELEEELEAAGGLADGAGALPEGASRERVEAELGDVLLAAAQLGTYLELDPEQALRASLRRFEARYRLVEEELGEELQGAQLEQIVEAWRRAKERVEG